MVVSNREALRILVFVLVLLIAFSNAPSVFGQEPAWWTKQKRDCGLPSNLAYNSWDGKCPAQDSRPNTGNNTDNGEADRIAREKAERDKAAREAEEKRVAEQKRLADEAKAKKEAADRQKAFEKDRDETLQMLRGSGNNSTELRGVDSTGNELRGSSNQTTSLRGSSPSGDPMVVDAQNVSSGMSRDIDDAITGEYKDAPPGVAERVSKGFQAVMKRDWKLAKAWFEDALNHDPTNIGLQRFIALCDYTYSRPQPVTAKPVQSVPKPTMSAADSEAYLKMLSANQNRVFAEDFDRQVNSFYRNYAPKHPELKFRVLVKPAQTAAAKKAQVPLIIFLRRFKEMILEPDKKSKLTPVASVRG